MGYHMQVVLASLGFAIFGMGAEITGITVSKVIIKWFTGHEVALAMGLQVAMARIGTAVALACSLPMARAMGDISYPVLFGALCLCVGLVAYLVYCVMDKKLDPFGRGGTGGGRGAFPAQRPETDIYQQGILAHHAFVSDVLCRRVPLLEVCYQTHDCQVSCRTPYGGSHTGRGCLLVPSCSPRSLARSTTV